MPTVGSSNGRCTMGLMGRADPVTPGQGLLIAVHLARQQLCNGSLAAYVTIGYLVMLGVVDSHGRGVHVGFQGIDRIAKSWESVGHPDVLDVLLGM